MYLGPLCAGSLAQQNLIALDLKSEKNGKVLVISQKEMEEAISAMNLTDNTFLIFERSRKTYLQAVKVAENQYLIEYQNESTEKHYQSRTRIDQDTLFEIAKLYSDRNRRWRQLVEWKKLPFKKPSPIIKFLMALLYLLMIIGYGLLLKYGKATLDVWARKIGISIGQLDLYLLALVYYPMYPYAIKELRENDSMTNEAKYNRYTYWSYVIFGPVLLLIIIWVSIS